MTTHIYTIHKKIMYYIFNPFCFVSIITNMIKNDIIHYYWNCDSHHKSFYTQTKYEYIHYKDKMESIIDKPSVKQNPHCIIGINKPSVKQNPHCIIDIDKPSVKQNPHCIIDIDKPSVKQNVQYDVEWGQFLYLDNGICVDEYKHK